tara:strand:- start:433 stop:627 length:195 start_codon:yes stop_codon:yes gene_type:complete
MKEADEAVNALRKLQELTDKYSNTEMDADQLRQSISERINASEELKDVMRRALEAKRRNETGSV